MDHVFLDSKFTFYRGRVSSQNDLALTNNTHLVLDFKIKEKLPLSDHCPCILTIKRALSPDLCLVNDCAMGFLNYDHFDVNKRIKAPINVRNLDLVKLNHKLSDLGDKLTIDFQDADSSELSITKFCTAITEGLYECCKSSKYHRVTSNRVPKQKNCTSKHFKAISDANYMSYISHLNDDDPSQAEFYRMEWLFYRELAWRQDKEDLTRLKSQQWHHYYANDTRKLWRTIDWKGELSKSVKNDILPPTVIYKYFNNIFNSDKTKNNPTICDIKNINELIARCPNSNSQVEKYGSGLCFKENW